MNGIQDHEYSPGEEEHQEYSPEKDGHYDEGEPGEQYEEEEDAGFVGEKLLDSKAARKRADEDAKLLSNRIALLKLEEKKAWKKIDETKTKAKRIMEQRQRNQVLNKQREERRKK